MLRCNHNKAIGGFNMKDVFNVKGNGKEYAVGDIVTVAGNKGKITWRNAARNLLQQSTEWEGVVKGNDRVAEVKLANGNFVYLIF
jgi:hypothetical protein